MDYAAIRSELDSDPLGRGYSGMTDEQVVDSLNAYNRTRVKSSMTGDEIFTATDNAEFVALTDHQRLLWVSFTSKDQIDPSNSSNIAFVTYIFGGGSTTVSNLNTARTESITRAQELLGANVIIGDVQNARAL